MKRLSVLLALLLSLSLLTTAASAAFADVPQDAWYASAVRFVEQRELFNGVGDDRFAFAGVHKTSEHVDVSVKHVVLGILMDARHPFFHKHHGDVGPCHP